MKKRMKIKVSIKKWHLVFVFLIGIFIILGVGVAYNSGGPPDEFGHSAEEIEGLVPLCGAGQIVTSDGSDWICLGCGGNQIIKMDSDGTDWICANDEDGISGPGYYSNYGRYSKSIGAPHCTLEESTVPSNCDDVEIGNDGPIILGSSYNHGPNCVTERKVGYNERRCSTENYVGVYQPRCNFDIDISISRGVGCHDDDTSVCSPPACEDDEVEIMDSGCKYDYIERKETSGCGILYIAYGSCFRTCAQASV